MPTHPPAGWYQDPEIPTGLRYWDGRGWTLYRAPRAPAAVPTTPPAASTPLVSPIQLAGPTQPVRRSAPRAGRVTTAVWTLGAVLALMFVALVGKGITSLADTDLSSGTATAGPLPSTSVATAPRALVPTVPKPAPKPSARSAPGPSAKPAPKPSAKLAAKPSAKPAPKPAPSPAACLIKGNIASDGERIYHVPGGQFYDVTRISVAKGERWFCSESDAVAAGWRKSKR